MATNKLHRGRLIDHVHLVVKDLAKSKRFYSALVETLGIPIAMEGDGFFGTDELYISAENFQGAKPTGRIHLAFATRDQAVVQKAYDAGLAAGGVDNGKPGPRPYHPGYYAGFLLDPDGNNIEVVYHGEAKYSAESIEIVF